MAFTELTTDLNNHQSLDTRPNINDGLTATQIKVLYDKAANDIKTFINDVLLAELAAITTGASGAHNTGSAAITGVTGTTVYDQIVNLKTQINDLVVGSIAEGTITEVMLAFDVATQAELDAVISAYQTDGIDVRAADATILHRIYMGV